MCGVAGYFKPGGVSGEFLEAMASAIDHRGPDDHGQWFDAEAGIALGHARLSVVDLSPAGHQPMFSATGRYVVAFNGEIYNHEKLRDELYKRSAAPQWKGHSDTETLLAMVEAWGLQAALEKCIGMFAIALWDRQTQTLSLARDRLGEKPLYYGWQGDTFLFGSELSALRQHPACAAEVDRDALTLLMRHKYIPAPYSIYQGIQKLDPGAWLSLSANRRELETRHYWDFDSVALSGREQPFNGSFDEAVSSLDHLLRDAVSQQMMADVPLGAFLSGGVDSSTIVALMQVQSSWPVKTFTIGFDEGKFNEAEHAKAVASHLGTEHHELYVSPRDALDVIPNLAGMYSEPFSDSSQIPTHLVSSMARQHVTVSLSGDGGDELFGGYNRYMLAQRLWNTLGKVPLPVRRILAVLLRSVSPDNWNRILAPGRPLFPKGVKQANMGDKLHKGSGLLGSACRGELYRQLTSNWTNPEQMVLSAEEPENPAGYFGRQFESLDFVHQMMATDTSSYLPDDILCKVDRAAMAVSLETRVPLLDHRIVEFAWRLPLDYKLQQGSGKRVLREVLYKYVPRELIERPKMGFGVPLDSWLRGPLRDWAESLLDESRLSREGYFNPGPIRRKWTEHLSGHRNWQPHLWNVLMFQAWLEA